jgi:hypothetical protein
MESDSRVNELNLVSQARGLRSKPIWIAIDTQDTVVSTTACLRLAMSVYSQPGPAAKLELHVVPSAPHTVPVEFFLDASNWVAKQFQ